ncbi:MAG TPA: sugar ABC transporter permease [Candidatus Limnocylindria bacterium]|nr:sugar ABC transporter permease [Candidatus Limnocylindria bacterium]
MTARRATGGGDAALTLRQQESRAGVALLSPTLVVVLAVVVLPILWTIFIAFRDLRLRDIREVGIFGAGFTLDNFVGVFTSRNFIDALLTTVIYSVAGTTLAIGLGLAAALIVRAPFRGRTLVRASMLLPYVSPVVAVAFVWSVMLDPNLGIVNAFGEEMLGWERPISFLSQRSAPVTIFGISIELPLALLTVIAFQAWRYFPFAFLFILARLQAVPADLDEAAKVDGASPLQRFRYILLPQLSGVIALLAVLRFIWTFNEFDDIYLLTGGGAGTEVVSVGIYNRLTGRGDIGAAAALSLVLAALLAIFLFFYFRFFAKKTEAAL